MLDTFISRCQVAAGLLPDASSPTLVEWLDSLAEALPVEATAPEQLMIRGLGAHVLARVLYGTRLLDRVDVVSAFMAWTASRATSDHWRSELRCLIGHCSSALRNPPEPPRSLVDDVRVTRG